MNTTTRRHPRSLLEAFPRDHSEWITRCPRPLSERVLSVLLACGLGIAGAVLLAHWWAA